MTKSITKSISTIYVSLGTLLFGAQQALAQPVSHAPVRLENPLNVDTIPELLTAILNIVIVLAVPIIVFFIIYSGYLYVTARGNAAQVEQATRSLTYAIIGGVLVIGAVAIAEIVRNLVLSF
jgi:Type IV secretion system pilin